MEVQDGFVGRQFDLCHFEQGQKISAVAFVILFDGRMLPDVSLVGRGMR